MGEHAERSALGLSLTTTSLGVNSDLFGFKLDMGHTASIYTAPFPNEENGLQLNIINLQVE